MKCYCNICKNNDSLVSKCEFSEDDISLNELGSCEQYEEL